MSIEEIKEKILSGDYEISLHAEKERYAESISIKDIETAISGGEMLENYPADSRGESCLILGYSNGLAIHIVVGLEH